MGMYKNIQEYDLKQFGCPKPTKKMLEEADEHFEKYIYYEDNGRRGANKIRNVRTTCCGREEALPALARTMTAEYVNTIDGSHNKKVACPFCGKKAMLKNLKKIQPKNFGKYVPVLFLRAKGSALYAIGAWAYRGGLDSKTVYKVCSVYRFESGRATQWNRTYSDGWNEYKIDKNWSANKVSITEPLKGGGSVNASYYVIGATEIVKTDMKYLPLYHREKEYSEHLIRLIAMYSIYPQIEMLRKLGHDHIIDRLIYWKKKSKNILDWSATNPVDAFGLTKSEYKEWMKDTSVCRYGTLEVYKRFKRLGCPIDFNMAYQVYRMWNVKELFDQAKLHGINPKELIRYIEKQKEGHPEGINFWFCQWKDYVNQAVALGRDMTEHNVKLPRDLRRAHDEVAEEYAIWEERKARKKMKELTKEEKLLIAQRSDKYNFEWDDMFIRVAKSAYEVTQEGKKLQHCVAGYAQRHMAGKTTILFLRSKAHPNTPLYTIEMDGNRIVQAHGYRNERDGQKPPRELYPELFEAWLDWITRGSKRDKNGNPILRKKYRKEAA